MREGVGLCRHPPNDQLHMSWDAIIFDCDGTLVDSEHLANEVLVEYVEQFGLTLTVEEALARFHGVQMAVCVMQLESLRGSPLPPSFVSGLRERVADAFASRLRPLTARLI